MLALITGGAKGLGRKLATTLLQRGGHVVIADIDTKSGLEFENEINEYYGEKRLKFVECDVSETRDIEKTFDICQSEFGRLNVICNNAGVMHVDHSLIPKQVNVNLTSIMQLTFKGIDIMSKKKGGNGGVIVNISSGSGYNILRGNPVYTATKFGVVGFSRSFKFLPHAIQDGVRVNCLSPLFLDTDMTSNAYSDNPEVEYQIECVGFSDMEDVATGFLLCIEDDTLNGDTLAMHVPGHIYKLKFPQPIPIPLNIDTLSDKNKILSD